MDGHWSVKALWGAASPREISDASAPRQNPIAPGADADTSRSHSTETAAFCSSRNESDAARRLAASSEYARPRIGATASVA